jgi:hypothetical protein
MIFGGCFGCFPKRYPLWWWMRETSATDKDRRDSGQGAPCPYEGIILIVDEISMT